MKDRFRVLIVNSCHWPLLARLPWMLHQAGCDVELFAPEGVLVSRSGYLAKHHKASRKMPELIVQLENHLAAESPYDWVILGDDPIMYELARHLSEPWVQAIFPARLDNRVPTFLLSKSGFPILAKQWGLPVPHTRTPADIPSAVQQAAEMGYPLLIKRHLGFSGESVCKVSSEAELLQGLEDLGLTTNIILQEMIQGETCCGVALYNHGELRGWMAFRNERSFPGPMGPATTITVLDLPELEPILERLGELTGYHGLGGVDFIRNPQDGKIILLEQHARPPQVFYLQPRDGSVDFTRAIGRMLRKEPVELPRFVSHRKPKSRPLFPKDLRQAIAERDWPRAISWLVRPDWWWDIPWKEPQVREAYFKSLYQQLKTELFQTGKVKDEVSASVQQVPQTTPVSEERPSVPL